MSPEFSPQPFRVRIGIVGATIRCSLFLWTATFSLPLYPNVVPATAFQRRCLARSRKRGHRKIISHSNGHLVVNRQNKKADTQRHQKSARALLSLQNDVLCIGFEIQRRDCLFIRSLTDSTKKHKVRMAVFSYSYRWRYVFFYFSIKTSCIQL